MTFKHSAEKILAVLARTESGEMYSTIAKEEGVSRSDIYTWVKRVTQQKECVEDAHRWILETPNGPLAYAVCRHCQGISTFPNAEQAKGQWAGKGESAKRRAKEAAQQRWAKQEKVKQKEI